MVEMLDWASLESFEEYMYDIADGVLEGVEKILVSRNLMKVLRSRTSHGRHTSISGVIGWNMGTHHIPIEESANVVGWYLVPKPAEVTYHNTHRLFLKDMWASRGILQEKDRVSHIVVSEDFYGWLKKKAGHFSSSGYSKWISSEETLYWDIPGIASTPIYDVPPAEGKSWSIVHKSTANEKVRRNLKARRILVEGKEKELEQMEENKGIQLTNVVINRVMNLDKTDAILEYPKDVSVSANLHTVNGYLEHTVPKPLIHLKPSEEDCAKLMGVLALAGTSGGSTGAIAFEVSATDWNQPWKKYSGHFVIRGWDKGDEEVNHITLQSLHNTLKLDIDESEMPPLAMQLSYDSKEADVIINALKMYVGASKPGGNGKHEMSQKLLTRAESILYKAVEDRKEELKR